MSYERYNTAPYPEHELYERNEEYKIKNKKRKKGIKSVQSP